MHRGSHVVMDSGKRSASPCGGHHVFLNEHDVDHLLCNPERARHRLYVFSVLGSSALRHPGMQSLRRDGGKKAGLALRVRRAACNICLMCRMSMVIP